MRRPVAHALLAAASLSLAAACASNQLSGPPGGAGTATVVHVIDGDTIDVAIAGRTERVRLIGIDTPETVHPNRPVQCYGAEASAFLSTLIPEGTEVRLERDAVVRDRFDRLLGYVYRAEDDLLVNLELVRLGYADAVTYGDNEALYPTFVAAKSEARAAGRGLWGVCGGPDVDLPEPPSGRRVPG